MNLLQTPALSRGTGLRYLRWSSYLLPGLVLALALLVSHELWDRERKALEQVMRTEFDARVLEAVSLFRERMLAYEQALHATRGLISAYPQASAADFKTFVGNLHISSHPGLLGLGLISVAPNERSRSALSTVLYFEPIEAHHLSRPGADHFAEPSRRPAMASARDLGSIAVSNKVKLPEEDAHQVQAGYRMYLPVYLKGQTHTSEATRGSHFVGWIYAAFSMEGLMASILGDRATISIDVYDGGESQDSNELIDTYSDRVGGESNIRLFYAARQVAVGGYDWTLTARALPNFTSTLASDKLRLITSLGIASSLIAALLTWLMMRWRIGVWMKAESLRRAKELAEETSRHKTQFLVAASHDLRQPLQALNLFVAALQALSVRPVVSAPEVTRIASRLQLTLGGLERLLNGLFDLSSLESGTMVAVKQPVNVGELLSEISNTFSDPARDKGLSLRVRVPQSLMVNSDPLMLSRVLSNLVSNALRYTKQGRILVGCRRRAQYVDIQICDTGIGIEPSELEHIFTEFYQVSNVAREKEHGLGLGLAIVQRSLALVDGQVSVSSILGKGSVFTVRLPRCE